MVSESFRLDRIRPSMLGGGNSARKTRKSTGSHSQSAIAEYLALLFQASELIIEGTHSVGNVSFTFFARFCNAVPINRDPALPPTMTTWNPSATWAGRFLDRVAASALVFCI